MREIKFRFWSKILGSFVIPNDNILAGTFKDENMVVMQYTGLKDKNGKEIYEGDVVNYIDCMRGRSTSQVEWTEWGTGFEPFIQCGKCGELPDMEDVVIIGNIYENPELLKSND